MSKPKILVCGGRDFSDYNKLSHILDALCLERGWTTPPSTDGNWLPDVIVISGKARGADTLAIDWAAVNWCEVWEYPADWQRCGKSAGYIRNKQMLQEGKPTLVVAFPGGRGTANMVTIAEQEGIEVIKIE